MKALSSLPEIDQRLLEDIRAGNCVAFVGAGFSAAAGLPKWSELLRSVADVLPPDGFSEERATLRELLSGHASVSNRELEMAAQLLFDALGERRCRERLRDALKQDPLPEVMLRRLKHLYGIPFRAIVTTNFDPLVPGVPPDPTAYRRLLRMPRHAPWREAISRAALGLELPLGMADSPDRPVVQLHGTLRDEGSLVFTRAQYRRRLYANPAYLTVLRALLATSTVLFLGYSLRDAYLNELRAELVEAFQGGERRGAGEEVEQESEGGRAKPSGPLPGLSWRTCRRLPALTTRNTKGWAFCHTAPGTVAETMAGSTPYWPAFTARPTQFTVWADC